MPQTSQSSSARRRMSDQRERADVTALREENIVQARMTNPAALLPEAVTGINSLYKAAHSSGIDPAVLELVHLRASQINGCSACVDSGARNMRKNGETDDRLFAVAAWRETPYFSDAARAALTRPEHAPRLADRSDAVPDPIWDAAAAHFTEPQLGA